MVKHFFNASIIIAGFVFAVSCSGSVADNGFETKLQKGWQMFSSKDLNKGGETISSLEFDPDFGLSIEVPSTVLHGFRQNNLLPDLFDLGVLENMDKEPFQVPWWYRTEFNVDNLEEWDHYQITFEGINYKANVWLNGHKVAGQDLIQGSYGVWNFDISKQIKKGKNVLAVEIIPPVFGTDVSKGFVDWNPTPADRSMGIWRDVVLSRTGPISMRHSNVVSKVNKETLNEAEITISTVLTNHSNKNQTVTVSAVFENIELNNDVELQANEVREIFFRPSAFDELAMKNPRLWWPNNMGEQALYDLKLEAVVDKKTSDKEEFRFGIREIEDFWNDSGYRGFMVNGQKVLIRSAGWVDDILLGDTDEKVVAQMKYAKHMNLNSIRLESFWGRNRTIMNMADELGILLMLGWTAHWEWEAYIGIPHDQYVSIRGEEAKSLHANNYRDQVLWHRRHPSVAIWTYGSDKLPRPSLEIMLNERMALADTTRPILSYCGGAMLMGNSDPRQSEISGPTGVKMEGPYDWVPPVYWYIDERYGGAFGFNTEVGPGPQIPPLSSLKKMIPEEHLWPVNDVWLYYSGRNQFENLDRYLDAFHARYGKSDNLEDFLLKNQIANYEAMRPMFEAFAVNKFHSTGVVQWMYNSAWPTFYWQLFDYYLMPNGAFYATRKASAPLVPIYNYGDKNIWVNNDYLQSYDDLLLEVKVFDLNSNLVFEQNKEFNIGANSAEMIVEMPEFTDISTSYFVDLRLYCNRGEPVENNFYWLSTVEDVPDFENTTWYWTPNKEHADHTRLSNLPKVELDYSFAAQKTGDEIELTVEVNNPNDLLAFFVEFQLLDKSTGEPVLPVFWDDNYISLLPGEKRKFFGKVGSKNVDAGNLQVVMQGINVK